VPWLLAMIALSNAAVGSQVCSGCHAGIYRKYMATGMARSSGRVGAGDFAERFTAASLEDAGAAYRVTKTKDAYRMEFARPSAGLKGERDLRWFIGSGRVGRSYVFSVDGFLFQAPVSYYSSVERWNPSPGYSGKAHIDLAKPIERGVSVRIQVARFSPMSSSVLRTKGATVQPTANLLIDLELRKSCGWRFVSARTQRV